jgi:hypothetical protein
MEKLLWFYDHLEQVLVVFHILAIILVNLTPTPKDDAWVAKVYRKVEMAAGLITPRAKE